MLPSLPYHRYSHYLQNKFSCPVRKISIDAGFSCPNRDGTIGTSGCAYCNNDAFAPGRKQAALSVSEQIERALKCLRPRYPQANFIVYFQPFSNTHAPVERLEAIYCEALRFPDIVGLAIGTRPDCLDQSKVDLLAEIAGNTYLQLELGLQSANNSTLARINRRHTVNDFCRAMRMCRGRGMDLCGHMITGLPGESAQDAMHTALVMVAEGITGIKIHNLHIVRGTPMAADYAVTPFHLLTMQEHVKIVCDILERLPWEITVQRLTGTVPGKWLIGPAWCVQTGRVISAVEKELATRGTRQGRCKG